jgi:hypothetical protein
MADLEVNPAARRSRQTFRTAPVLRAEHIENTVTRVVEQQTAKIPSDYFLVAAFGAMAISLFLELRNRQRPSRFVGMWVGPLLTMGVYNKLVKALGVR